MNRNRIFFLLFIISLIFGQLQRFQLTPQIAMYAHEVILVLWVLSGSGQIVPLLRRWWHYAGSNIKLLIIYLIVQLLIWQFRELQLIQLLYMTRLILYLMLAPLLVIGVRQKTWTAKQLIHTLVLFGLSIAGIGLIQYFLIPDTRFLLFSGWDDHYYRLISTLFDPNFSALVITLALLVFLQYCTLTYSALVLIIPILLASILLTYSRAGFLALSSGGVLLSLLQKKRLPFLVVIFCISAIPFLPRPDGEGVKLERTASIISRLESNQAHLRTMEPLEWLVGTGLYRQSHQRPLPTAIPNHATTPDNSWLFLFTSLGILGTLQAVYVLIQHREHIARTIISPVWIAVGVHSMFNNSLFLPQVIVMLLLLTIAQWHISRTESHLEA